MNPGVGKSTGGGRQLGSMMNQAGPSSGRLTGNDPDFMTGKINALPAGNEKEIPITSPWTRLPAYAAGQNYIN